MEQGFWSKDWVVALAFSATFVLLAYGLIPERIAALERRAYDLGVRSNGRAPSDRVVVVAIDDASVANLGPYPWSRRVHAQLLERLRASGAKVVASTIFFSESRDEPGLAALGDLSSFLAQSPLTQTIPGEIQALAERVSELQALAAAARPPLPSDPLPPDVRVMRDLAKTWAESSLTTQYAAQMAELQARVDAARNRLAADDALGAAMRAFAADVLPMRFTPGGRHGTAHTPMPAYVRRFALTDVRDGTRARASGERPLPMIAADRLPLPDLGKAAGGIGHLLFVPDADGVVRSEPLVVQYADAFYPSIGLMTAAAALGLGPGDLQLRLGEGVRLGRAMRETSSQLRMRMQFYGDENGRPPFPTYSFHDVRNGTIPAAAFKDKIVLVGTTDAGLDDALATPLGTRMPPVMMLAHSVSSLVQGHVFTEPPGSRWLTAAMLILVAAYLALLLPMLGTAIGAAISAGLVLVLLLTEYWLLAANATWVHLTAPAVLLIAGHLLMTARKLRVVETLRASIAARRAASGRLPGPASQVRGPGPRDTSLETLDRAPAPAGTPVPAGAAGTEKPMLGRYLIERELGKGAMGVVYLGRDPKIGRRVAIKTMALSGDFAADDINAVKERFFREAEAAGSLSHPHIVQIFEAGEEHDLAYIAMEFIEGHDLVRHTQPAHLLPVNDVIKYIADAADALDYAHSRNVVHRDIKPANLMLVEQTKTIKVTDFGIARITDASKTKTGMVLGTPSYMSPEQLSGKKVDGRSDLFSLGVTLYQLLTASLPFKADSMATLMYKIANETQRPVTSVREGLPAGLDAIIAKALQKHCDRRYARGADLARDLRAELLQVA